MHIGVDTHKKTHVLVALDARGQVYGTHSMANTPAGWAAALQWARDRDAVCVWGIENSGSLGKGFAQFLLGSGETAVHEIVPHRTAQYRKRGRNQDKTDHTDALAMARLLQAESGYLPLVERDDASTELRLLSDHRDNLVAERTRLVNQLHAQMLQIDPCYTERSGTLTSRTGIRYCHSLDVPHADGVVQTRLLIVRQLTEQLLRLWEEVETVETALAERVRATETPLLNVCGIGVIAAARLIGELGCTPRIHSAAALAALAGIAPVAVSSGGRNGHRLNRGGNRRLNRTFLHDRGVSVTLRAAGAGLLREEAGGGEDGTGRVALSETAAGRCGLSAAARTGARHHAGCVGGQRARAIAATRRLTREARMSHPAFVHSAWQADVFDTLLKRRVLRAA